MEPQQSLMIKNLMPGLTERGKIKIGRKGETRTSAKGTEYQLPEKLDHFLITTLERDDTGNFIPDERLHDLYGDEPTTIPVRLLFDDIELNFQSRYACYTGRTLWCSGDGERAMRVKPQSLEREVVGCTCERILADYQGRDPCKINGTLSVMIDGAPGVGGVWKFRTTSFNTVRGMMSSLALIRRITGGVLAGVPLNLILTPKTVTIPNGAGQTVVYVVGLEYGGSPEELQQIGYKEALGQAHHHARIGHIEEEARRMLLPAPGQVFPGETADDVVEEFYPDQATVAANAPPRPQREDFTPQHPDATIKRANEIAETAGVSPEDALTMAREETAETVDPDTGEVTESEPAPEPLPDIPEMIAVNATFDGMGVDWEAWGKTFSGVVDRTNDLGWLNGFVVINEPPLSNLKAEHPTWHEKLMKRVEVQRGILAQAPPSEEAF